MNTMQARLGAFALACGAFSCGHPGSAVAPSASTEDPAPPPAPPAAAPLDETVLPPTVSQPAVAPVSGVVEVAPPASQWVYSYPTGQWVYSSYGWIWVPANTVSTATDGVPYVYLYTPSYGWTWYVSPWGPGRYHYGTWVRHPWTPAGWHHGWVARPHVVVHGGGGGRGYAHRR